MNLTDIDVIRELLYKNGFRFSKSMGQNFLTSAWVPEEIAESAGLDENTGVLEIGPGIGCLTAELSKRILFIQVLHSLDFLVFSSFWLFGNDVCRLLIVFLIYVIIKLQLWHSCA